MSLRTCRACGCTDDDCSGCIARTGEPCHWVEADLCSACLPPGAFPEGWQLGAESWSFHRQFYFRFGRPSAPREYTAIIGQIRDGIAIPLGGLYFRVSLADGTPFVVRGGNEYLCAVEAADWTPPAKAQPRKLLQSKPPARAPPVSEPPPAKPLRASTLTLGNPAAARVLADRLRRLGVPQSAASQAASP
jgi:hypothetical protein